MRKIGLIIGGIFLCIILLETALRIGGFVFLSFQERVNKNAFNGGVVYRILCLGDSMTALAGEDSYPNQLQIILNQKNTGIKFNMANKGVPGIDTTAIAEQIEDNLDKYNPDMVIIMMGINDEDEASARKRNYFSRILKKSRVSKLIKFLCGNILKKTEEMGIYKPKWKERNIADKINESTRGHRYIEMEEIYKEALLREPENGDILSDLGWWYVMEGKTEEAEKLFKEILVKEPNSANASIGLGWSYIKKGRLEEAKSIYQKNLEVNPGDESYGALAFCYMAQKEYVLAEEYFNKADRLRLENFNPITRRNYQKIGETIIRKGIKLVCMQYPCRSIGPLKNTFSDKEGIIFIDNEALFRNALKQEAYSEYFVDNFAGDFGHCTRKGNKLMAENIADVILKNIKFAGESAR